MGYEKEEGIVPRFSRELFERIKIGAVKDSVKFFLLAIWKILLQIYFS